MRIICTYRIRALNLFYFPALSSGTQLLAKNSRDKEGSYRQGEENNIKRAIGGHEMM
jgi:hypothetical protein